MEAKRRDFIKAMGASGAFLTSPLTLFGKSPEEQAKEINKDVYQTKQYTTDVLIAGGGMAGVCAALSAARNGAKVILIQDRSRLGGNASSEIRMHVLGATALRQVWRETGILEELFLTEAVDNQQRCYEMWDFVMYDKVISEKNITLLLDTVLYETEVANNEIKLIRAICSQTEEIYEIKAKYYADCTGDATLGAQAGAEFMRGREAKSLWGESLAVDVADNKSMGNSLLFMSSKHDRPMPYTPPAWAKKFTAKDFVHRKINTFEFGYWWLELGGMVDIIQDGQKIRHELLTILFGVWDYIKNSGNHPESENWALSWVGMIPGKRESRRLVGDYIMKQEDIQSAKLFPDRVSYGGWPLDDHPPEGMSSTDMVPYVSIPLKAPYSIPFRSLYSKNIKNLLMAGRNVSVSHVALSSTRVMATCAMMGQAIGTGMAYCLAQGIKPTVLGNQQNHMSRFQQILLRQDQGMLGVKNKDDKDLARQATVKASSETKDGAAVQVLDGFNRNVMDGKTHQWQAEMKDGEPWLEISWNKPVKFNTIQLTFDTGLHRRLLLTSDNGVYFSQERGPQPETIAAYTIMAGTKQLVQVENNYMRRAEHRLSETVEVQSIRISVQKTHGDALARLFEVRCYLDDVNIS
ncbi:FAD-dependent oxidoreductase [Arundinibacter roseus]|uniref:FAD-dependent oxidoreductase n=1 Tax=Arundinibacter roseus TaxID=2070510 RepID=A0A4R4JWD6_9BACT|nr:FAD-dependent oxidoreductase [Arundinibacter roseus]TDB58231.1 FAD-dependent oxidoreductase [Arundinibacter roseus]